MYRRGSLHTQAGPVHQPNEGLGRSVHDRRSGPSSLEVALSTRGAARLAVDVRWSATVETGALPITVSIRVSTTRLAMGGIRLSRSF